MHELRIAEDLGRIVIRYAGEAQLTSVERVNLIFGQYVQIVPALFEAAFREVTRDTVAAEALLSIEIIAAEMRCRHCGVPYLPENEITTCSACGSDDIDLVHGKELYIKSIEGE
jgi:hydrogenase nickel incorporation protein HypA/HybF